MNIILTRYGMVDGVYYQEQTSWLQAGTNGVEEDDPRCISIAGKPGRWLLHQIQYPLVDLESIFTRYRSPNGEVVIPHDHPYWQYYSLPARPGVTIVTYVEYQKAKETSEAAILDRAKQEIEDLRARQDKHYRELKSLGMSDEIARTLARRT